jgi:ABC-2 type transport system ATP-binding protein
MTSGTPDPGSGPSRGAPESLVLAAGLTKRFGKLTAVDGVDLDVGDHQLYGIVGPDGAGKTTLLRLLVGILGPDAGTIRIAGFDGTKDRAKTRLLIGYMSQAFSLYEDLSVDENIRFFGQLRGVKAKDRETRASRVLEATGLQPFRDRHAGKLSGGMKQKLGLTCTLVHEPRVLFLDEPTNGVDPVSRREFWAILGELRERITVVVTTPSLEEAERCDKVALMTGGKILRVGSPDELRREVIRPVWEVEVKDPFQAAAIVEAELPEASVQLFGDTLHVVHDVAEDDLRSMLQTHGHTAKIVRRDPSLEDAYVQLVTAFGAVS